ncbi:hypothetical protein PDIG_68140 [Penicillium digitatum PHI26]|uniref:Uncharacterized protein n=2 Tax=Penicillium digitatum TaxID=36651 RepID=K9FGV9_PEND2|nr:hypothetical protein PDIP_77430 [Penicillium digitatum Pd1]EKV06707.1 hypothetical protein PDIP_77430 [Penicillium digitatum Pd1]EKV08409.1 hypothetical protein PDIG_68140 [Penicillium digitatum PHI26]
MLRPQHLFKFTAITNFSRSIMSEITPTSRKKQIILNAFVMNTPGHLAPGLWKHPRNKTDQY